MNRFLCVCEDNVSGAWSEPFTAQTEKEAIRNFAASLDAAPDYLRRDAVLYCIGTVCVDVGTYRLCPSDAPRCLATGSALSLAMDKADKVGGDDA